jgi:hypothetical protein
MTFEDDKGPTGVTLSSYERRLWVEIDRILYQNYLTPKTVTDFWSGDREAVVWHLKQMKDRVVRTIIIMEYVEIDDVLNRAIAKHFFKGLKRPNHSKRFGTLQEMLDRLYPQQKLDVIKSFKEVPRDITNHIMALNMLRNSFAHHFHLLELPKSKRLYKGKYDVFTKAGLKRFKNDMWEVHEFFDPEITSTSLALVRSQRERNERLQNGKRI